MSTRIQILKDGVITVVKTASDKQLALNSLVSTMTANRVLKSNGTNIVLSQIDLATDVTGVLPPANGGFSGSSSYVDLTTNQTISGIKHFNGELQLPNNSGSTNGTIWRSGDVLNYRDGAGVIKVLLNSAGNLSNLANKQTSLNNLVETQVANRVLRSDGTNTTLSLLNLSSDTTGVLSPSNGGTGSNTQNFVDLTTAQTIAGIKTFSNSVPRIQAVAPGFWLDETDHTIKGAYLVLDGGVFQLQRRATNFGAFEAIIAQVNIITGDAKFNGTTASTSTTTGALTVGGGLGVVGDQFTGGFTSLGDNVALKVKYLTGTSGATDGSVVSIAHGLTHSKIMIVTLLLEYATNNCISTNYTNSSGFQYDFDVGVTAINVRLKPGASSQIVSKPLRITILYSS